MALFRDVAPPSGAESASLLICGLDFIRRYMLIIDAMRRKPGHLLPIERAICSEARDLAEEFHGYQMAKRLRDVADSRLLTAHGTLYRALSRLEDMGLLTSRWEDPHIAARENRPGRRLYSLTALGERVASDEAIVVTPASRKRLRRKWAPA